MYNYNDIVNSLIPQEFKEFIDFCLGKREEKYIRQKNIEMKVLPEFKELFKSNNYISRKLPGFILKREMGDSTSSSKIPKTNRNKERYLTRDIAKRERK